MTEKNKQGADTKAVEDSWEDLIENGCCHLCGCTHSSGN